MRSHFSISIFFSVSIAVADTQFVIIVTFNFYSIEQRKKNVKVFVLAKSQMKYAFRGR